MKKRIIIFLGSDHAGFKLKEKVKSHLAKKNYTLVDISPKFTKDDDYPVIMKQVAKDVVGTKNSIGIIFGGSGQGEAMTANRVKGARAAVLYSYNEKIIKLSKQHNNANIISLGARFLTEREATQAVDLWLKTSFSNEPRHKRRIRKLQ